MTDEEDTKPVYSEEDKTFARVLGTTPSMVHDARTVRALEVELQTQMLGFTKLHLGKGNLIQENLVQLVMTEKQAAHLASFISGTSVVKTVRASVAEDGGSIGLSRSHADMQGDIIDICSLVQNWRDAGGTLTGVRDSVDSMSQVHNILKNKGYIK